MRKFSFASSSRVNACTIRIPAMSSASVAVTSPSRSRTCEYARPERERKSMVATLMNGITASVASARRQSRTRRITAVPHSKSVLCTSVVTPSVTSWSIASTSFVIRLIRTPARFRS